MACLQDHFARYPNSLKCHARLICRYDLSVALLFLSLLFLFSPVTATAKSEFDHFNTGFPLTGLHAQVECAACHLKGIFKGTPQECNACHNGQIAPGKHPRHIASNDRCDNCHSPFSWAMAAVDHGDLLGACRSCHDGVTATGQTPNHVPTGSTQCDGCHGTLAWIPVRFDHDLVVGSCSNCHNGVLATGKHAQHVETTSDCDLCHFTMAWIPARGFNHENAEGRCSIPGCHSLPVPHIPVNPRCDACHSTSFWNPPLRVDHAYVQGACRGCHNCVDAPCQPAEHPVTTQDCGACHRATRWLPVISFAHTSADFPGQHNPEVTCTDCHGNSLTQAIWPNPEYKPDCAGCHTARFNRDPQKHKKSEGLQQEEFYTVDELPDCTNSPCHLTIYNENGTVREIRPVAPRHFSNSGNF